MYFSLLLGLSATSLATPALLGSLSARQDDWTASKGTAASCAKSDKVIAISPQLDSSINEACSKLLPPCAYPQKLSPGTFCIQTITFPLDGPKKTTVPELSVVTSLLGLKASGFVPQFSVNPPFVPENLPPVSWTKQDCVGYFKTLLSKAPQEGCLASNGYGPGSLIVGGKDKLSATLFDVSIVAKT